jgi:hypothetical protein
MRARIAWERVGIEGLVIVVSILLALAVQAWWEGRQERRQEAAYLGALREELKETQGQLAELQQGLARNQHSHEQLVAQFPGNDLAPPDSLMLWLSSLSFPGRFNPPTAVLDDLASSGSIRLIRDDTTRLAIARYESLLRDFRDSSDQAWAAWAERIQPFLEGRISRVDRLLRGTFPRPVPFSPAPFSSRYSEIFAEPAFQDMIAERWIRIDGARNILEQIAVVLDEISARIDRQIGRAAS